MDYVQIQADWEAERQAALARDTYEHYLEVLAEGKSWRAIERWKRRAIGRRQKAAEYAAKARTLREGK